MFYTILAAVVCSRLIELLVLTLVRTIQDQHNQRVSERTKEPS